jgi:hypothetical protein
MHSGAKTRLIHIADTHEFEMGPGFCGSSQGRIVKP